MLALFTLQEHTATPEDVVLLAALFESHPKPETIDSIRMYSQLNVNESPGPARASANGDCYIKFSSQSSAYDLHGPLSKVVL